MDDLTSESFYNALAPYYKAIYPDWEASVKRQALALDHVIREFIGEYAQTVLDLACGIGTQSIGLANLGYQVSAADLSSGAIEQARIEAARHNVAIDFQVADMRQAWESYHRQFDIVIACDNSIPHLLNNQEILAAFRGFYACTRPGGGCIISVRDYAQLERPAHHKQFYPRLVHSVENGQVVIFDVWDFYDQDHYEITIYLLEDSGSHEVKTQAIRGGRYYCIEIPTLERLFLEAGFKSVTTLTDRFFQPLLVAVKQM
jgi:SAM-dependent methyltransferase